MRQMVNIFAIMSQKTKASATNNLLNDPEVAYITAGSFNPFHILTGIAPWEKPANDFDIIKLARKGFSKSVLLSLAKRISLNIQELAVILHISERTLQRYDDDEIIKTE